MGYRHRANTASSRSTRIVILGSRHVGKTTIAKSFVNKWLPEEMVFTASEDHLLLADTMTVELIDKDFRPVFTPSMKTNLRRADGVILVYAVDDAKSFEYIQEKRDEILHMRGSKVPIIVVANKTDSEHRDVNPVMADCLVTIDWEHAHVETSALHDEGLQVVFDLLFFHPAIKIKTGYCIGESLSGRRKSLPANAINTCTSRMRMRRQLSPSSLLDILKRRMSSGRSTAGRANRKGSVTDTENVLGNLLSSTPRRNSVPASSLLTVNHAHVQRSRAASFSNMLQKIKRKVSK